MSLVEVVSPIGEEFSIQAVHVASFVDIVHEGWCEVSILGVGNERVNSKIHLSENILSRKVRVLLLRDVVFNVNFLMAKNYRRDGSQTI